MLATVPLMARYKWIDGISKVYIFHQKYSVFYLIIYHLLLCQCSIICITILSVWYLTYKYEIEPIARHSKSL